MHTSSPRRSSSRRWTALQALALLGVLLAALPAASGAAGRAPRPRAASVSRSFAYHQLTASPTDVLGGGRTAPLVTASGNKILFAVKGSPIRFFEVNPDGTGLTQIDSIPNNDERPPYRYDVSGDGSVVAIKNRGELRSAGAGGPRSLLQFNFNGPREVRVAAQTGVILFNLGFDEVNQTDFDPGLYAINADGTGSRIFLGRGAVAALLQVADPDDVGFGLATVGQFEIPPVSLAVSADGSKVAFGVNVPNPGGQTFRKEYVLACNGDGSGLHPIAGPFPHGVSQVAISPDGSMAGYVDRETSSVRAAAFDGSGDHVVLGPPADPNPFSTDLMQFTQDNSLLLLYSRLYHTDGSGVFLDVRTPVGSGRDFNNWHLVAESSVITSMNSAGNRFAGFYNPTGGAFQLAEFEIDPVSLGAAPGLSNPSATPDAVAVNGASKATVSAQVSTNSPIVDVRGVAFAAGRVDLNLTRPILADAGGGLFRSPDLSANGSAALGPRTVRLLAEVTDANGLRHATAVDLEPFAVVAQPPDPTAPLLSSPEASPQSFSADGGTATLTVNASDEAGVTGARAEVTAPDQQVQSFPMERISGAATQGTWRVQVPFPANAGTQDAVYQVRFFASDAAGNNGQTGAPLPVTVRGLDNQAPVLSNASAAPPNVGSGGGQVTLQVSASDTVGVTSVQADVTAPGGGVTSVALSRISGGATNGVYSGTFLASANATFQPQTYSVTFEALDAALNEGHTANPVTFTVAGKSGSPKLSVDSTRLDFGTQSVSTTTQLPLTITNSGGGTLTGKVGTLKAPFRVVSGGGSYSLGPGQARIVTVEFTPKKTGKKPFTGKLTITSNDKARKNLKVTVTGKAS